MVCNLYDLYMIFEGQVNLVWHEFYSLLKLYNKIYISSSKKKENIYIYIYEEDKNKRQDLTGLDEWA